MRAHNAARNGREAWKALVEHFEGEAQRDRVKDAAYAAIAAAKYHGEKKRFTFETYVTIHQDAYADLEQYGEVISEEKRVRDLLTNVKDTSPAATAAKGTILATPTLRNSFTNAVAHLATTLQLGQSQQKTRNVSGMQSAGKGNDDQKGGGRGRGKGGRSGRGGRGGRGGRNIYLGCYSPDQWRKLSPEDRKRVYEGRQKSADEKTQASALSRQLASVGISQEASVAGGTTGTDTLDQAIMQGALQGSAAVGEKRSISDSAGSQMSRRRLNKVVSSQRSHHRNISRVSFKKFHDINHTIQGNCELDSHADTCVAGSNCVVLEVTDQTVNVSAFSDQHETMKDIPIVTAAMAYDDPKSGQTYILIMGQAIYMENMPNSLLCPNQLRYNGICVDDCPKHLAPRDRPSSHSIYSVDDDFNIPLSLMGVTSYFVTRTPTTQEIETCKWITLTSENNWNPHSEHFSMQEESFQELKQFNDHTRNRNIYQVGTKKQTIYITDFQDISHALEDNCYIKAMTSTRDMNTEKLALTWNIALDSAKKTLKCTTQKGVCNVMYPVKRRFRTKQAQLRYKQLSGRHGCFYTDTFFASVPTLNGSKMAQIYINDLSFCKVYPMKQKSSAPDTLNSFIHEVGIPHRFTLTMHLS
jgi:hypothetical protein